MLTSMLVVQLPSFRAIYLEINIKIIDSLLKESSPFCFCRAWSWTSGVENTWKKELLVAFFYISHGLYLSSSLNHKRGLQITPWIRLIDIAFNIMHEHYGPRLWASIRPINKVQAGSHLVGWKKILIILWSKFILYQKYVFDNFQEQLHKFLKILILAEAQ